MNLQIDPQSIQVCMKLWRDTLSNAIPMATEFQIHFIQERPTILKNHATAASAWLIFLRSATPADSDRDAFSALVAEVEAFKKWAEDGLAELERLALQTALQDGMDELALKHPDVLANLTKYLNRKPGTNSKPSDD